MAGAENIANQTSKQPENNPVPMGEDVFLDISSRTFDWIARNRAGIFTVIGVVIAGGIAWAAYEQYAQARDKEASILFFEALETYTAPVDDPNNPTPKDKRPKGEFYASQTERLKAAIEKFAKVKGQYGSLKMAALADYYIGNSHYELGEFDKAIPALENFVSAAAEGDKNRLFALETIGFAHEAQKNWDKAAETFTKLGQAVGTGKFYKDVALYHQGRMALMQGKKDEAIKLFRQAIDANPDSALAGNIKERILYIETGGTTDLPENFASLKAATGTDAAAPK
ncbi:MAG: hypothetical protein GMKNLPBB_01122 [Myxococcota bacterium]|nr:hypothetical protein [Myxococcota bacterium]